MNTEISTNSRRFTSCSRADLEQKVEQLKLQGWVVDGLYQYNPDTDNWFIYMLTGPTV